VPPDDDDVTAESFSFADAFRQQAAGGALPPRPPRPPITGGPEPPPEEEPERPSQEELHRRIHEERDGFMHSRPQSTERKAAKRQRVKAGTDKEKVLASLKVKSPMTDHEIAAATGLYHYTAAPRRKELCDMGLVRNSGVKHTTPNDSEAIAWELTELGRYYEPEP